jgi:hypothetical protein
VSDSIWLALLVVAACGGPSARAPEQPTTRPISATFESSWRPIGPVFSYLAPADPAAYADGSVDVVFHFHAGHAAEPEYRAAGLRVVVADITLPGFGTTPYWNLMDDPNRFDQWKSMLVHDLSKRAGRPIAIRHIALVAWSAGFVTVQRILAQKKHYDEVDAVILLDGLHCGYVHHAPTRRADLGVLSAFVRFAKDAAAGKKLFVFTHSSIQTFADGYASTTEVADALAPELGMTWTPDARPGPPGAIRSADLGDAHLRGFAGEQPKDHVAHDHFIGVVLKTWLAPRW